MENTGDLVETVRVCATGATQTRLRLEGILKINYEMRKWCLCVWCSDSQVKVLFCFSLFGGPGSGTLLYQLFHSEPLLLADELLGISSGFNSDRKC